MGLYDLRCALTGLSLKTQRCDLILLRSCGGQHQPIWGAVTGRYNRLGTIDDPPGAAPERTHIAAALAARVQDGSIVEEGAKPEAGEAFFERFEPNRHRVHLEGDLVVLTLIHHRVVDFIVREGGDDGPSSDEALFAELFARTTPIAPYAAVGLGRGLRRLRALGRWLGARPFPLPRTAEQHTDADVERSIRDAKKRAPALREAIEWAETEDYRL